PGYKIIEYGDVSQNTQKPCFINIMFQVTDMQGNGISTLSTDDFSVKEDGQAVSPTESAMQIRQQDVIPYTLKTVLLIDNSYSVGSNLSQIKEAAKSLVLSKLPKQQFAIYVFSENPVLIQDFSDDATTLVTKINEIELGYASTNLYGSIIEAVNRWEDFYHTDEIQQGFLIAFTDGSDTQASSTEHEAIVARGTKKVYMVGLGNEIDPQTLQNLGNAGSYSINNINELADKFTEIQADMAGFANSFYWMNYMTPKRGNNEHTLRLIINDNSNTGDNSYLTGEFNSNGFYSVNQGLYVNATESDPYGIKDVMLGVNDTLLLEAATYLGMNPSQYSWSSSNNSVIQLIEDESAGDYGMKAIALGEAGETATVTVHDLANALEKSITFTLAENVVTTTELKAFYSFDAGNATDDWAENNGVIHGATATADRNNETGKALNFDGSDYIDITSSLLNQGEKTITFWTKFDDISGKQILISNTLGGDTSDEGFTISKRSDNTLEFLLGNGSDAEYFMSASTSTTVNTDVWYFIAMTYNGNTLKGYINNELRCSATFTSGTESSPSLGIKIAGPYKPVQEYFKGSFDQMRFYQKALSEGDLTNIFEE
ncbi:MAG: LamG-like jellyroll fold domain-containing protein, partial [Bacteroidota bacterium]|nr:LamG-like jellyroll fold domain-containing protein [Bacteroidota bacterium]